MGLLGSSGFGVGFEKRNRSWGVGGVGWVELGEKGVLGRVESDCGSVVLIFVFLRVRVREMRGVEWLSGTGIFW